MSIKEITEMRIKARKEVYNIKFINEFKNGINYITDFIYDKNKGIIKIHTSLPNVHDTLNEDFKIFLINNLPIEYKKYVIKGVFYSTIKYSENSYEILL